MHTFKLDSKQDLDATLDKMLFAFDELPEGKYEIVIRKPQRTPQQNNSLHLWFTWIAEALNGSSQYLENGFFSNNFEARWDADMVKELLFRTVIRSMYKVESTTELTTEQHSHAVEVVNDWLATKKGIIMQYPNENDKSLDIKKYEIT